MHCVRKVTEDLYWVGSNDRRLELFENIFPIQKGVSYNSYLLLDEKTVLFDTVDNAVGRQFLENIAAVLNGRTLDYLVINHMEPVQVSLQMNFPKDWIFLSMTVPILNSRSMTACMTPRQKPSVILPKNHVSFSDGALLIF